MYFSCHLKRAMVHGQGTSWFTFCERAGAEVLRAGIHHADIYVRVLDEVGDPRTGRKITSPATISRRISAIAGFYRYAARERAVAESPFLGIERPSVGDDSPTTGLTRDELRRLMATA